MAGLTGGVVGLPSDPTGGTSGGKRGGSFGGAGEHVGHVACEGGPGAEGPWEA